MSVQASNIPTADLGASKEHYHTPKLPTVQMFNKLKEYRVDIVNGKVYRLKDDREVGHPHGVGMYYTINVCGRQLKRANVVWWAATGEWPTQLLDHDNRNKQDDRLVNLIPSTSSANVENRDLDWIERDLPRGIYHEKSSKTNPFRVQIAVNGKLEYLGLHPTLESAQAAYDKRYAEVYHA